MPRSGLIIQTILFLALSVVLAWVGVSTPVHFRAVAPVLVERAGEGTPSVEDLSMDLIATGQVGPVRILWEADTRLPRRETDRQRVRELLRQQPLYWHSGGPAAYYESFLRIVNPPVGQDVEQNVVPMVLPRAHREALSSFLSSSSNLTVRHLLDLRAATGWTTFMPVRSAAGQPLDASILTLALLVQSDGVQPELRRRIQSLTEATLGQDSAAQDELEDLFLAVLSLGRRLDWNQLAELMRVLDSVEEVRAAAQRLAVDPDASSGVYTAALLLGDFAPIGDYLDTHGEDGLDALEYALPHGRGALELLINSGKILYSPPSMIAWLDVPLSWIQQDLLVPFSLSSPQLALYLKLFCLLLAGFSLTLASGCMLEATETLPMHSRTRPIMLLGNTAAAFSFMLILWMLIEPNLLRFGREKAAEISLDFNVAVPVESLQSQKPTLIMLDQATIIILLFYFFLQLVVYAFGVLKISQLKRQDIPAHTKLRLLENEDNLFDLGLYIGLGGTVTSLILLAMRIVEASLIGAYSSTLFGIIFVALLKIGHLRPYRRSLILRASSTSAEDAA